MDGHGSYAVHEVHGIASGVCFGVHGADKALWTDPDAIMADY